MSETARINKLSPERKLFLDQQIEEHEKRDEVLALKKILLSHGGEHLDATYCDLVWFIIQGGFLMTLPSVLEPMEESQCHRNTARLVLAGRVTDCCTGYALLDGVWHEHSWGLDTKKNLIV